MRIVAFAPACNPRRGSEGGVGWWWSRLVARLGETWVITRARNREAIEAALPDIPERDRLHFVYADSRWWPERWRYGKGRSSVDYLLWQPVALRAARRLHQEIGFDLAWHITFANAWLGSLAGRTGPPFVYGPVGGGVGNAWRLIGGHGLRGAGYETIRAVGRALGRHANPVARRALSDARVILVQNPETRNWLPRRHRARALVCPNPVLDDAMVDPLEVGGTDPPGLPAGGYQQRRPAVGLYAGRLVAWKGMFLALRALTLLPEWRLIVCGKGRDLGRLQRLAGRLGVADRVLFEGFIPRQDLLRLMREQADVLVFPSLHEEAGWVVAEARASGLPIVCMARGGPPVIAGTHGVEVSTIEGTARALAEAMHAARANGRAVQPAEYRRRWTLARRTEDLAGILAETGLVPAREACLS
jgi:glycosyltransferase involved in cell wall biosynthesis